MFSSASLVCIASNHSVYPREGEVASVLGFDGVVTPQAVCLSLAKYL